MAHITRRDHRYWPRGIVDYTVRTEDFSQAELDTIQAGIDHWAEATFMEFVRHDRDTVRRDTDHYLEFIQNDNANNSRSAHLGMDQPWCDIEFDGGRQRIIFDSVFGLGTVIHEIGHAVGFLHEHNRRDRNEHVEMHWDRITTFGGRFFNMQRAPTSIQHGPYDLHSVMHYSAHARKRTLSYDIDGVADTLVMGRNAATGITPWIPVLFNSETGEYRRWLADGEGRIVGDPIEEGVFDPLVTDVLHVDFREGTRELRFNQDTGRLAIHRLRADGRPFHWQPATVELGDGPWSSPCAYVRDGAVHFLAFHRDRRELLLRVLQHRTTGLTRIPRFSTPPTRTFDHDFTHIYHAQIGALHRVFLVSSGDHTAAVLTAPIENLGNEINRLRWPGQWGTPSLALLRDSNGDTVFAGYARRRGRVITFNLRADGTWTQYREQNVVPGRRDIAVFTDIVGTRYALTLLRQRDDRLTGEVFLVGDPSLDIGDKMEFGDPSMTRRDNGGTDFGRSTFLTSGDIAAANFMVDRDLQVHDIRSLENELGNRIHIENLQQGYRDILHFRAGPATRLLFIPSRDNQPLTIRSVNRSTGEILDDQSEVDLGPIDHATVLYPGGRAMLFAVHRNGELVRYPLNNDGIDVDRASEPEPGFNDIDVLTGFTRDDDSFIVGYERIIRRAWVRRLRNPQSRFIFDGGLETFRLDNGIEDICVYRTRNRTHLVAVGDGRPTRFMRFVPRDMTFVDVEDGPDLGRNFNQVEVSTNRRTLYLYRANSGRTEFWNIDPNGWIRDSGAFRSLLEDRPDWTVMHAFGVSGGMRLLFAREPGT